MKGCRGWVGGRISRAALTATGPREGALTQKNIVVGLRTVENLSKRPSALPCRDHPSNRSHQQRTEPFQARGIPEMPDTLVQDGDGFIRQTLILLSLLLSFNFKENGSKKEGRGIGVELHLLPSCFELANLCLNDSKWPERYGICPRSH